MFRLILYRKHYRIRYTFAGNIEYEKNRINEKGKQHSRDIFPCSTPFLS